METISIRLLLIFGLLIALSACSTNYVTPLGLIADPNHEEIASIRKHTLDSYIVMYNPVTCSAIGDACAFFRTHAYAHYRLNHTLMRPKYYPALTEKQADCYAAKYGESNEIEAAVNLLLDENRDPSLKIHGDPSIRAQNITDCARQAGNWIGN
jgi:hypothetical protein